jgi:phosphopantothenoylcysteine decarboxylase/phosphopantothenate--cysteine ligase
MALIALGVTGGIGAYKAVSRAQAADPRPRSCRHDGVGDAFVGPVTFEAITRRRVITDQFEPGANADIEHIALASTIDLLLIAPQPTSSASSPTESPTIFWPRSTRRRAPVLIAPAMNTQMFDHHAVRRNLETLAPAACDLSSRARVSGLWMDRQGTPGRTGGDRGGRRSHPRPRAAARTRVLVTAGPTFEDVDPVRFIGNRSSGRMGFAIAAEAARRGAEVTLVAGPTAIAPPAVGTIVRVRGALEMHHAVIDRVSDIDVVIMAAAVADYMPAERAAQKGAKTADTLTLVLTKTPDILGDLARRLASGEGRSWWVRRRNRTSCRATQAARNTPTSSSPTTCPEPTPDSTWAQRGHPRLGGAPRHFLCNRSASRPPYWIASKR